MTTNWTVGDVAALMDRWYPRETAEDWDRVGLIVGNPKRPVRRILLAVDPVHATVGEALADDADMMITHHPLYLRGVSFLPETDPKGHSVADLIRGDVALFNAHTNADIAVGGVSEALANLIGLEDQRVLVSEGEDAEGRPVGHGRVGMVAPQPLGEFADRVAERLPAGPNGLLSSGDPDRQVRTIAVSGGSGDSFLEAARQAGADVYLCADLRHHPSSEHLEGGAPDLLCGSHWATEWPWLPTLATRLRQAAQEAGVELTVTVSTMCTEPWTAHRPTTGPTAQYAGTGPTSAAEGTNA